MRICVFSDCGPDSALGAARIWGVYEKLRRHGCEVTFLSARLNGSGMRALGRAGVIVIQRDFRPFLADVLCSFAARRRIPVIHELDDLLTRVPASHPERAGFRAKTAGLKRLIRRADAHVVSTPELLSELRLDRRTTRVVPAGQASYGFAPLSPRREPAGLIRIGFAGTASHGPDLKMITAAVRQIDAEYAGRIEWCFYGCAPGWTRGLSKVVTHPVRALRTEFFKDWRRHPFDIGLAPLRDTAFNRAKDSIKVYDYSQMGAAGIYSRLPAYRRLIEHRRSGMIVANRTDDWVRAIRALCDNQDLRVACAVRSQKNARERSKGREKVIADLARWMRSIHPLKLHPAGVIDDRPVLLYGTGSGADDMRESLRRLGLRVLGHVESVVSKRSHRGLPVFAASRARPHLHRVAICSTVHYAAMSGLLERTGMRAGKDFL